MHARRYALIGLGVGLGLPLLATFVEGRLRYGGSPLVAQGSSPLLWMIDTVPLVAAFLAWMAGRRQDEIVALEHSSEQGFLATAKDVSAASRSLLSTVQSFSAMTAETAASVKETTQTMSGLSKTAMQAALTAETVIGLAQQSLRSSEEGLQAVEVTCAGMVKVAEEVRGLSARLDALNARMRDILALTAVAGDIADRSESLADRAETEARQAASASTVALELRRLANDARGAARRVHVLLGEAHKAMLATLTAVEVGGRRAESGAEVAAGTGETIRKLAATIRESSQAAKQIATVAQQQDRAFDEVLKAMNEIYKAVEEGNAATQQVAREAKALHSLAEVLKNQAV